MNYDVGSLILDKKQFESLHNLSLPYLKLLRAEIDSEKLFFFSTDLFFGPSSFDFISYISTFSQSQALVFIIHSPAMLRLLFNKSANVIQEIQKYPAMIIDMTQGEEQYKKQRNNKLENGGSLHFLYTTFSFFPLSGEWFIYANDAYEIAVLHAPAEVIKKVRTQRQEQGFESMAPNDFYMHDE